MADAWSEAWSRLTNSVEHALDAGMTEEEIYDAVDEAMPVKPGDEPDDVIRQPKPKKSKP